MKRTFALLAVLLLCGSIAWATTTETATLAWGVPTPASGVTVAGYNVYRATVKGGPYTKLTAAPVTVLTYSDAIVNPPAGQIYYYVVTTVGSNGAESVNSNEVNTQAPPAPASVTTKIVITVTTP
jgi:fibronectin type 3 domain-containing protein